MLQKHNLNYLFKHIEFVFILSADDQVAPLELVPMFAPGWVTCIATLP